MFISNENINNSHSITIIPANAEKSILILVLGRASDVFWRWEAEEGFKRLYAEVEAICPPGNDPSKQDLVLTMARLIWIRREMVPKNPVEAYEEIQKVLGISTSLLTQELIKEAAMSSLANRPK